MSYKSIPISKEAREREAMNPTDEPRESTDEYGDDGALGAKTEIAEGAAEAAPALRWISVYTATPESVGAYLYDHSTTIYREGRKLIIQTEADDLERAEFLADYQAGRLQSGLHGARVHATYEEAMARLREMI